MHGQDMPSAQWRKSSYSGGVNNCVEIADLPTTIAMRDSKDPSGGRLGFPHPEWAALLGGLRNGEL